MNSKKEINLPLDYSLVLQQIIEDGEDDLDTLKETLNIKESRLMHILHNLLNRGLIIVDKSTYSKLTVRLSRKGMRVSRRIWPEYFAFM